MLYSLIGIVIIVIIIVVAFGFTLQISINPDTLESETGCTFPNTTSTMTYNIGTMPLCPTSSEMQPTGLVSSSAYTTSCSVLTETGSSWNTTAVITEESTTFTIYTAYTSSEYFVPCNSTTNNINITDTQSYLTTFTRSCTGAIVFCGITAATWSTGSTTTVVVYQLVNSNTTQYFTQTLSHTPDVQNKS